MLGWVSHLCTGVFYNFLHVTRCLSPFWPMTDPSQASLPGGAALPLAPREAVQGPQGAGAKASSNPLPAERGARLTTDPVTVPRSGASVTSESRVRVQQQRTHGATRFRMLALESWPLWCMEATLWPNTSTGNGKFSPKGPGLLMR